MEPTCAPGIGADLVQRQDYLRDRKSIRLNSSHGYISYAVFCLKKKKRQLLSSRLRQSPQNNRSNSTWLHVCLVTSQSRAHYLDPPFASFLSQLLGLS